MSANHRLAAGILGIAFLLGCTQCSQGSVIYWSGNGHYYEYVSVTDGISWDNAVAAAAASTYYDGTTTLTGHLVTITSGDENSFVSTSVLSGDIAWAGASLVGDIWTWVTGEDWNYTDWYLGTPTGSGLELEITSDTSTWTGQWLNDNTQTIYGYVIEYDADGGPTPGTVPEPASLLIWSMLGFPAMVALKRRRAKV